MNEPALTPDDWEHADGKIGVTPELGEIMFARGHNHALAALCLHEQEFGFTRTDVTMHREAAQRCFTDGQTVGPGSLEHWHNSMADRIEALLPPKSLCSDE